ncbi:flagellar basal-body rod protein FlgG [Caldicoprobacter guelmensis]|uniref:flagellar basal-body rod protein FlgF n=1 Tax=Caldicoprobacter guelmensis TaxID=1170224 RepID=UPI00195A47EB|nr:flagellar basal-body rod protein FlgF [Caldicoprobacter guelmensis]MBM7582446.1 flagellar basal-body rod protein FlgG [Caldicoprobacter guelmensis]
MVRGLYAAATGMINQATRLDKVANNIANVNTRGFKRDQVVSRAFDEELLLRVDKGQVPFDRHIGTINHGVYVDRVITSFEQGVLQETGEPTHVAIRGDGFFVILTEEGERYTRDGGFMLDNQGRLVTVDGWPVAGERGPIFIESRDFVIDSQGNVIVDGVYLDRLRLVNFQNLQALRKVGHNLYINPDPENNPEVAFAGEVAQGFVEGSNVDVVRETVDMIIAVRNYESNQKVIKMIDGVLSKTVNELGRV